MRKVSVLIPTRNRLRHLQRMLRSYRETVMDHDSAELVFRCDADDIQTVEFLRQQVHGLLIVGSRLEGYKSLPRFFNEMSGIATGDLMMCCNDDAVFITKDWPRLLLDEARKYPDGVFDLGVNVGFNDSVFPFSCVSRQMVGMMGLLNDERLLYSDVFLRDVANHFGRAIYLPHIQIVHEWVGHEPDQTRKEASHHEQTLVWKGSTHWSDLYRRLHDRAVSDAVQKISKSVGVRV